MASANLSNLPQVYGLVTIASLGVGAVIIPCSIIAQLACPHELVGTITAITLSLRYVGGAIGFTAYYNVFYHKLVPYATEIIGFGVVSYVNTDLPTVTEIVTLALEARFGELAETIDNSPATKEAYKGGPGVDLVTNLAQETFQLAYRYPCKL